MWLHPEADAMLLRGPVAGRALRLRHRPARVGAAVTYRTWSPVGNDLVLFDITGWLSARDVRSGSLMCPVCDLYQLEAAPGASGSAIVDVNGRVVGLLTGGVNHALRPIVVTPWAPLSDIRAIIRGYDQIG